MVGDEVTRLTLFPGSFSRSFKQKSESPDVVSYELKSFSIFVFTDSSILISGINSQLAADRDLVGDVF